MSLNRAMALISVRLSGILAVQRSIETIVIANRQKGGFKSGL
jgi:hypothetical protein